MTTETLEELRERLLRQHNVQQMIQVRAYEIYKMRGGQAGSEAQDWFHAESEVLAFLLADESAREDEPAEEAAVDVSAPAAAPSEPAVAKKPRSGAAKPTQSKPPTPKKAASKRATPKKPAQPKTKSTRIIRKSKTEESHQ